MSNKQYQFDIEEMIETHIQARTDYRVSLIICRLALSTSLVLLFLCGFLGTVILKDVGWADVDHVPTKQPN